MDEPNIQTHIIKKKKKITSLYEFLDERRVSKGNKYTHTSMSKGSFYIDQTDYKQFLKLYYNHVFKEGNKAYLTEKHLDISPILIVKYSIR